MPDAMPQTAELVLRDIHLPEPVSWWPPAPGWWLLAGTLIIMVLIFLLWRKLKQRKQLKKSALAEFENIRAVYHSDNNTYALVQSLSILLRRSCISFYPRASTASLTGELWLDYLDKTSGRTSDKTADNTGFKNSVGRILATAPYMPENHSPDIDAGALLSLCENWLQVQPVKQQNADGTKP